MKILIFSNAWDSYVELRSKYVEPVIKRVKRISTDEIETRFTDDSDDIFQAAQYCFKHDIIMVYIPPDTFMPFESVLNLIELAKEGKHIAIPHLRVNRETYEPDVQCGNERSCRYAFEHLHYTAKMSFPSQSNLWHKGIHIRELPGAIVFTHALPTIYACKFNANDIECLSRNIDYKYLWDNQFMHNTLNQGRLRIVGSSDICCAFETTKTNENLPPTRPNATDEYQVVRSENRACQMTMYTMRYQ